MKSLKVIIKEDKAYSLEPHDQPFHQKVLYNGIHVGNIHSSLRQIHKAVPGKDELAVSLQQRFRVHPPEGYEGNYVTKDFDSIDAAKRHAFTQYQLGSIKWKN